MTVRTQNLTVNCEHSRLRLLQAGSGRSQRTFRRHWQTLIDRSLRGEDDTQERESARLTASTQKVASSKPAAPPTPNEKAHRVGFFPSGPAIGLPMAGMPVAQLDRAAVF